MSINTIIDLVMTVTVISATVIVGIYLKHKTELDKKAAQGDLLAKSMQMISNSVAPLVYKAEKDGGSGSIKFASVINSLYYILDVAHLPHPSDDFTKGEIEKAVKLMNQTTQLMNTADKQTATKEDIEDVK